MTLDNISNGDRTKWDYFLNMNTIEFLTAISYFKDKQDHIETEYKRINRR